MVAVVGSPFNCISRWVDMYLRELLEQITSYVKNSNDVLLMLKCLNASYENGILFTSDATAMRPNMNTEEGLTF